METMWNKLRYVIDLVTDSKKEDEEASEFILLKDFNKLAFRLYRKDELPEEDDEDEEGEEQK
jgi:hypothetical protein